MRMGEPRRGEKREKKAFNAALDGGGQGFLIIRGLGDGARRAGLQPMEIPNSTIPALLPAEEMGNSVQFGATSAWGEAEPAPAGDSSGVRTRKGNIPHPQ